MDFNKIVSSVVAKAGGESSPVGKLVNQVGGTGGVTKLLSSLQSGGLADQVKSWVGHGTNEPVSADQVASALGPDKVKEMANETGLSEGEVTSNLAEHLPNVVNEMTPEGQLPDA